MTAPPEMCKAAHMELQDFLDEVEATDQMVSKDTGLNRSTIYRIRHKTMAPSARTMLILNDWAEKQSRSRRIPRKEWLDWSYLKEGK